MSRTKKDRWSEDEILSLPAGELDYFDRKSGAIASEPDFQKKLAKALSAFANSGGGHLILGVRDDGAVDGVAKIHKGRATTREWLEQAIPYLLSYPLQDFRVHEADPATATAIPAGRVVIVIDVGDSERAPHQDTFTKLYYQRVGGHSVPATHLYLESLRLREKYPSKEIVEAWRDYAIRPLLSALSNEKQYLEWKKWTWDSSAGGQHGLRVIYLNDPGNVSANQEQFLEAHPDIQEAIDSHDAAVANVINRCEQLYEAIKESSYVLDLYRQATSPQSLQELKAKFSHDLRSCETDEEVLKRLFAGDMDQGSHLTVLAELIVNETEDTSSYFRSTTPLWNTYREKFLAALYYPPTGDYRLRVDEARDELIRRIQSLTTLLKTRRLELSKRYSVPVEEVRDVHVIYREGLY